MVQYVKDEKIAKKEAQQYSLFCLKWWIVASILTAFLSLFTLILGLFIVKNSEIVIDACFLSLLFLIIGCKTIYSYCKTICNHVKTFQTSNHSRQTSYIIEKTNDDFVFKNLTEGKEFKFAKNDIQTCVFFRDIIILRFTSKQYILLPRREDLVNMFQVYSSNRP